MGNSMGKKRRGHAWCPRKQVSNKTKKQKLSSSEEDFLISEIRKNEMFPRVKLRTISICDDCMERFFPNSKFE
jgi:formylmethanofuran dehydrogenase subunit E